VKYLDPSSLRDGVRFETGSVEERLVQALDATGVCAGWAFQNTDREQLTMANFNAKFYELLLEIQETNPELFPGELDVIEDFHLSSSHRRGATTRATEAGVSGTDIDWINRWNEGRKQGSGPIVTPMRVVYSDHTQLMEVFLRFSRAL
jgi:hypothetical protein